jgi:hypothetical protein
MFEFNNRVDLQRTVIKIINNNKFNYEFTGLTQGAIESWVRANKIENIDIIELIYIISSKLFFLANKSQEQITEDYKILNAEINIQIERLKTALKNLPN